MRISFAALSVAIADAAGRRLDAAAARQAAADVLILDDSSEQQRRRGTTSSVARMGFPRPGLTRAAAGWLLAWWLDLLSRIELTLARSIARDRTDLAAGRRPAARARDGPHDGDGA